jgi:beta-barrel assembly-enhancing protease
VKYENPEIPEGINVTPEHPLKEFAQLVVGVLVVVVVAVTILALAAEQIARRIPFATEVELAAQYRGSLPPRTAVTDYLQQLADRLAAAEELPPDMHITVHYVDSDTVNAFATIGGHVVFFRGLLEKVPDENSLAMVMAHEIAHVRERHPIMSLGRGVVIGLALSAVANLSNSSLVGGTLNEAGLLTMLTFSRQQEAESDRIALEALARVYGHATGADTFFNLMLDLPGRGLAEKTPAFLATHPATRERIAEIRNLAQQHGWALTGALEPLPEAIRSAVTAGTPAPAAPVPAAPPDKHPE